MLYILSIFDLLTDFTFLNWITCIVPLVFCIFGIICNNIQVPYPIFDRQLDFVQNKVDNYEDDNKDNYNNMKNTKNKIDLKFGM